MRTLAFLVLAAAGCSSFDEDVFPHVVSASLAADPARPDASATIAVTLRLVAGPDADRAVALGDVELWRATNPPARAARLDLAFPGAATLAFHAGEERTVALANVGTTNAELAPLCGQTFYLTIMLAYPEEPGSGTGLGGETPRVTVACE